MHAQCDLMIKENTFIHKPFHASSNVTVVKYVAHLSRKNKGQSYKLGRRQETLQR